MKIQPATIRSGVKKVNTITPQLSAPTPAVIRPTISPSPVVTVGPRVPVTITPSQIFVIAPSRVAITTAGPSNAIAVEVPERGAWDERGWAKNINGRRESYEGYYRAGKRQFRGRVETRNRGRQTVAYIFDPPPEIRSHRHRACFQQVGNGWFILHWARPARTVDDAILYMEKVLDESLGGRRR